jgi:hypothetical protein
MSSNLCVWVLSAVVHTYNPRYLGGRDWEDYNLRSAQAKILSETPHFHKPGMVACTCHSSYVGGTDRRILVQTGPSKNVRPTLSEK